MPDVVVGKLERAKGFEPSTPTLARLCSTPELHPRRMCRMGGPARPAIWRKAAANATSTYHRARLRHRLVCRRRPSLQRDGRPNRDCRECLPAAPTSSPSSTASASPCAPWTIRRSSPSRRAAPCAATFPAAHTKNLFLKDKKDALFLVVAEEHADIDMRTLHKRLDSARLSFGRPELLLEHLGVVPGSVTPFAAINDREARVTVVLDAPLLDHATSSISIRWRTPPPPPSVGRRPPRPSCAPPDTSRAFFTASGPRPQTKAW